jgi:general secretion pathway protein F
MPIFRYKGYGSEGKATAGTIEADGVKDATLKLRTMGLHPKEIHEQVHRKGFSLRRRADAGRLPAITRHLSVLLHSGVPLVEALRALGEESKGKWREILIGLRERVTEGASLSRAMEDYQDAFPEFSRSMVQAGEKSGTLDSVLGRIADFLEGQMAVREKVKSAMIYPIFLTCVSFVVLAFLFAFVVPKIVKIFEDMETALPLATVTLICISNLFVNYWWAMIAVLIALLFGGRRVLRTQRRLVDRVTMSAFGSLYLTRFARTLSFLLEGGLPMLKALELAGRTSGNSLLYEKVRHASSMVTEGASLSSSLSGLPPVLLELIGTGEKSGKLVDVLGHAADSYEAEFDRKVQKALVLLEPTMLLVMGLVVGYIVFAILLPLFQLNQLIK